MTATRRVLARFAPVAVVVFFADWLSAGTPALGSEPSRPFESAAAGVSIVLPEGWDVSPGTGEVLATARSGARSISVSALKIEGRGDAAGLTDEDVARLWGAALREVPDAPPEARPSGQGEASLGGSAARFAWTRVAGGGGEAAPAGGAVMLYTVMAVRSGTFVRVTLVAPQAEYRATRQLFDASVKTFTWLK